MADKKQQAAATPVAELEYMPSAFEMALLKHRKQIIIVAVLAIIGTAVYFAAKLVKEYSHASGGVAFYRAETVEDYQRVASAESGKRAAGNALLMAAQLNMDAGKPDKAIPDLESFVKDYSDHPLADLGLLRLAEAHLAKKAVSEANSNYDELIRKHPKSVFAPLAMLRQADLAAGDKKIEEARKIYENLKLTYPGSEPYLTQATTRRDMLERKDPVIVPYVPEPASEVPAPPGLPPGLAPNIQIPPPPLPEAPAPTQDTPPSPAPAPPAPAGDAAPAPAATPTPADAPAPSATPTPPPATPAPAPNPAANSTPPAAAPAKPAAPPDSPAPAPAKP